MKIKSLLLIISLALISVSLSAKADDSSIINSEDHATGLLSMEDATHNDASLTKKELRQERRAERKLLRQEKLQYQLEKRMTWIMKKVEKKVAQRKAKGKELGGIDDPQDKWFWYWLILWGAGIVFAIIAAALFTGFYTGGGGILFGLLSTLCWLGGSVCFIIWLINAVG